MAPDPAPTLPPPTSPWVILGSIPRVAELESGAGASTALAAPGVSRLSVSPRVFPARTTPRNFPFVLTADDASGLLLLSAVLDAPLTRVDVTKFFYWPDDDPRYFVPDAATGSGLRLPTPSPQEAVEHQAPLGLLACPGGGGRYEVAELLPFIGGDTATLRCYYPDVGKWVEKRVRYPRPGRPLAPVRTLAQSVCWRDDDPRYFVLDAATGSAFRLPDPAPQEPVEHQALLDLLACPGGGGRYVVAELLPLIGGDTADLRCYYSDVGEWVTKSVRYPLPGRPLAPIRTLSLHCRLLWADYSWGVLTADPFADDPVLGFVPLPRPCVLPIGEARGVLDRFRYVGVSAGNLRFVDTYRRGGGAPNKVTVWTLPDPDAKEWVLEHEATFADIWADDNYKATGLPKKPPVLALIHPHDPAIVYFFLADHLFAVDVPARKVVGCDRYHLVAPPRDYGIANRRAREQPGSISSGIQKQGTVDDLAISTDMCCVLSPAVSSRNSCRAQWPKSKRQEFSKEITITFCGRKFQTLCSQDSAVIDLVYSVLLRNKITYKDFYLRINNGKILDEDVMVSAIISLEDPIIEICPRLRAGHPIYSCTYERFDTILAHNMANLHRKVLIPTDLRSPGGSTDAVFLTHLSHSMLHGLMAHVLSDGHSCRKVTWDGNFTCRDVLMSADGHIMIDSAIVPTAYTDAGGDQDYAVLHGIALDFSIDQNGKKISPVHFDHLLKLLQSSTADLRKNRLFVLFLVCHPSLLTYCEKYKLYGLVQLLLGRLTANENVALDTWLLQHSGGHDKWHLLVGTKTRFDDTLMYKAKKDSQGNKVTLYKPGLRQGFKFGRNYEAHPPKNVLNSLAEDALDNVFFFLLTIVIQGLVETLKPGQSADDLADILSNTKADPATVRRFWPVPQPPV